MSDLICELCNGITTPTNNHVIKLSDDKKQIYVSGHKNCIDDLHSKIKSIKDLEKKSVDKIIKELNIKVVNG